MDYRNISSDYISDLTDEDLHMVCDLIPLKHIRTYFKCNPQKFRKICSISRAEKVSPELAKRLILSHRNDVFISDFLNAELSGFLDATQENISASTNGGNDIYTAILQELPTSIFRDHLDIYVKLAQKSCPEECIVPLQKAVEEIKKAHNTPIDEQPDSEEGSSQKDGSETFQAEIKALHLALENKDRALEEASSTYEAELQALEEALAKKESELAELRELAEYADFSTTTDFDEDYPFTSLCRVGGSNGNSVELIRLADIIDGIIQPDWQENFPQRNILFTKDRYNLEGYVGIWAWKTEKNLNPTKLDYIVSKFLVSQVPTQVITISGCTSTEELKEILLQGIDNYPESGRILYAFAADERYVGLLCDSKDFLLHNKKAILKSDITSLPVYEFSDREILKFNGMWFFYRIKLGIPKAILRIIDPPDAIRKAILRRVPWSKLKTWFAKKDAQRLWQLLDELPDNDLYQEISLTCGCSLDEAKSYTNDFIQRAETYLQKDDIDSRVLIAAIENSPTLLEKCRTLNETTWRKEHASELMTAQTELEQIKAETHQQQEQKNQLTDQWKQIQGHMENISLEITQKEKLAADVEAKVAQRISAARKDAAEFISEMAFAQSAATGQIMQTASTGRMLFQSGSTLDTELVEHQESWDAISTIQEGLEDAGVVEQYSLEFAAYLHAAYTAHIPLLLAGPNGRDIADALSAALCGRTASILCCEGEYNSQAVEEWLNSSDEVVAIQNLLNTSWIDHIPELLRTQEKFVIVLHPFAEDLVIEPKGLYNYLLPVLTELFVGWTASRNFSGGYFCKDFPQYKHAKPKSLPFENQLSMPLLVQNRLRQIVADMKSLAETSSTDVDILFGVLPYAYVTRKFEVLCEKLQQGYSLSKEAKELIQTLGGDLK